MWTRAAVGGNNTRLRLVALLPQAGSAGCKEHLSSAQHSRFGVRGFVQPSSLPKPLQGTSCLLVPLAFWLYNMEGAYLLSLCCWSVICFFLGLATLLVGTAFGKNQLDQERNSNAQSKIFALRTPRAILCHQIVSWDV